jgi:hypothetical protein
MFMFKAVVRENDLQGIIAHSGDEKVRSLIKKVPRISVYLDFRPGARFIGPGILLFGKDGI